MKKLYIILFTILSSLSAKSQIFEPVKWSYAAKMTSKTTATIFIKATIDDGWHIYGQNLPKGGPNKTSISFTPSKEYTLVGKTDEPMPLSKYDDSFGMTVTYFEKSVIFQQKVIIRKSGTLVKGRVSFMSCDAKRCLPEETINFSVPVRS